MTAPKIDRIETSPYAPVIRPTRAALFRWHWFGRFIGRERPAPTFYVYIVNGVAYANPCIHERGAKTLIVKDCTPTNLVGVTDWAPQPIKESPCHWPRSKTWPRS